MNAYYIYTKELRSYLISPMIYVVLTIYMILSGYFFYTDLAFYDMINIKGTINPIDGLWNRYFYDLRFVFILLIPLITMKQFAEEKKLGTFELIMTCPVTDMEIMIGKYFACLTIFTFMLILTGLNVLYWGSLWGFTGLQALFAGYCGLFLLGCSLIACGIFCSTLSENQAVAGIITLGIFFLLWFLTWNEMIANEKIIGVLVRISLFDRLNSFFQGIINTKDIAFFLLFIIFFQFLTIQSLGSRLWRGKNE